MNGKAQSGAFAIAYLIGHEKVSLKNALDLIKQKVPDLILNSYFFQQLEQYDLSKLSVLLRKKSPQKKESP